MRNRKVAIWQSLKSNYAAIMAVASLAVAVISLLYSVDAQKTERAYKEIMIRPKLELQVSGRDLSIKIINTGLGPAQIVRVVTKLDGECVDSKNMSEAEWRSHELKIASYIATKVIGTALESFNLDASLAGRLHPNISIPSAGHTIIANGEFRIAWFTSTEVEIIRDSLIASQTEKRFSIGYSSIALRLPLNLAYCSASFQTCEVMQESRLNCPP